MVIDRLKNGEKGKTFLNHIPDVLLYSFHLILFVFKPFSPHHPECEFFSFFDARLIEGVYLVKAACKGSLYLEEIKQLSYD